MSFLAGTKLEAFANALVTKDQAHWQKKAGPAAPFGYQEDYDLCLRHLKVRCFFAK